MATATRQKRANTLKLIDELLSNVDPASKTAEANTEAGGYQGSSSHPSADADDSTQKAEEGARSSENTSDVKADQGSPAVDNASESGAGTQDDVQMNIGVNSSATGEDSSIETASAKSTKDDGGTRDGDSSHPARTDNSELNGGKFAADLATLKQLNKRASELGNSILGALASNAHQTTKQAAAPRAGAANVPATPATPAGEAKAAADLADTVAGDVDPAAIQALVVDSVAATIKSAHERAIKTAAFLDSYEHAKAKRAEHEEEDDDSDHDGDRDDRARGGGGPSGNPSEAGGEGGEPPASAGGDNDNINADDALAGMLGHGGDGGMGGEGGMGGGMPGGGVGGGAPGGGMPGADPLAAGGGAPPMDPGMAGAMGGAPGGGMPGEMPGMEGGAPGGGGQDPVLMLAQILHDAGISPEELQAAVAGKQAQLLKKRAAAHPPAAKNPGWKAKTADEERKFAAARDYILELTGRRK